MMLRFFAFIIISLAIMPAIVATITSQALAHKQDGTYFGGADNRREGIALGE
jgi:hypothetical protein